MNFQLEIAFRSICMPVWCKVHELPIVIHNKIENHIHLVTRSFSMEWGE